MDGGEGKIQRHTITVVTQGGKEEEIEVELELVETGEGPESAESWREALLAIGWVAEVMGMAPLEGSRKGKRKNGSKQGDEG